MLRTLRAAEMIPEGCDSSPQVAIEAGFYDQSHMNRQFRDKLGMTPGAYRGLVR